MSEAEQFLTKHAQEDYCYLTTVGRKTGKPHEIEIWFGVHSSSLYLLSGGGHDSDWVKNLIKEPSVKIRLASKTFNATAYLVQDKNAETIVRNFLADKYKERETDGSLSDWARTALVVGFDLHS